MHPLQFSVNNPAFCAARRKGKLNIADAKSKDAAEQKAAFEAALDCIEGMRHSWPMLRARALTLFTS